MSYLSFECKINQLIPAETPGMVVCTQAAGAEGSGKKGAQQQITLPKHPSSTHGH